MTEKKGLTIRMDKELVKKLKIKVALNDTSINDYVTKLIEDDVDDVDLSKITK